MPWFMSKSFAIGTALPHSYNRHQLNIYFRDFEGMNSVSATLLLVHEAYHIQQYHDLQSMSDQTSGWGFNRRFIRYYLGWYFQMLMDALLFKRMGLNKAQQHAYRQHPMEVPAYNHENAFGQLLKHFHAHESGTFLQQFPFLVIQKSLLPERPSIGFLFFGSMIALFVGFSKPIIEGIILLVAFVLGGRKHSEEE